MVAMVVFTLVALAAAAFVLVAASVAESPTGEGASGPRGYLADLRAGLRTLRDERRGRAARRAGTSRRSSTDAADAADAEGAAGAEGAADTADTADTDEDVTLEDFFAATQVQAPAYVAVEDLTDTLARARDRAARGVHGLSRR